MTIQKYHFINLGRKVEMDIKFVCKKCNKTADIDIEKSTKNFTVYQTKCKKCGSQTVPKVG